VLFATVFQFFQIAFLLSNQVKFVLWPQQQFAVPSTLIKFSRTNANSRVKLEVYRHTRAQIKWFYCLDFYFTFFLKYKHVLQWIKFIFIYFINLLKLELVKKWIWWWGKLIGGQSFKQFYKRNSNYGLVSWTINMYCYTRSILYRVVPLGVKPIRNFTLIE